jgi:hypothetical protein
VQLTKTKSTAGRHCPSLIECDLPSTAATHQLRQLGDQHRDPPRLLARGQLLAAEQRPAPRLRSVWGGASSSLSLAVNAAIR